MNFFSANFFAFILIVFIVYFLLGKMTPKYQWMVLFVSSVIFYLNAGISNFIFIFVAIFTSWFLPLFFTWIDVLTRNNNIITKKIEDTEVGISNINVSKYGYLLKNTCLFLCIFVNVGMLISLKYKGFLFNINGGAFENVLIPLGISYYTFQSVGYCIDVFRGIIQPETNFFRYATFVLYFPHISQGPIGRYADISGQLFKTHTFEHNRVCSGMERMVLGMFKKAVISNNLAKYVSFVYGMDDPSGKSILFATFLYGIQLYADFSGYMDIILGISQCFGITLSENFENPYFSPSIAIFWRRWHITLGSWFRDYVYYPVLRSDPVLHFSKRLRKKGYKRSSAKASTTIGLIVTWTLIGLWHGAAWKYVAHGLYHGSFIILDIWLSDFWKRLKAKFHVRDESRIWKTFTVIRTYIIVNLGYVLFRSDRFLDAIKFYNIIFTNFMVGEFVNPTSVYGKGAWYLLLFPLAMLLLVEICDYRHKFIEWLDSKKMFIKWSVLYILMFFTVLYAFDGHANSINFIYYDF